MRTNIFIPKKIKVGFQNRDDTYTKKLAYVIYYDQSNKLRKEASWNSWRDDKIDPEDYDNEPTTGFVLNKKVGGVEESWYDVRKTYVRVYDPRGFEFEITIPNFLYILENCSSIKGKGLEGSFVYGWDGKELVLIPTDAPEYKEMQKMATTLFDGESIKAKDLVVGHTYGTADGTAYVYMGKSDYWDYEHNSYICTSGYWDRYNKTYAWAKPLDDTWLEDICCGKNERFRNVIKGKKFWFINPKEETWVAYTSVSKKFYSVIDAHVTDKFAKYQDILDSARHYSPVNYAASKIVPWTYEQFEKWAYEIPNDRTWDDDRYIMSYVNGELEQKRIYRVKGENKWYIGYCYDKNKPCQSLEKIYEQINPVEKERYLMSGKLYKGWY